MNRSLLYRAGAIAAALLLVFLLRGRDLRGPAEVVTGLPAGAAVETTTVAPPAAGEARITRPNLGFRSPRDLTEHYAKHAAEFGNISKREYLQRAQILRDRPAGGDILEQVRTDGVITRFDRATGDFLAVNPDGVIRTYFRPNDGEAYFRRQARRGSTP